MRLLKSTLVVAAVVAATASPAQALTARTLSLNLASSAGAGITAGFSGTLSKSPVNTTVYLQLKSGTKWLNVKTAKTTTSAGAFAGTFTTPSSVGTYTFRAYSSPTSTLGTAASASRTMRVRITLNATTLNPPASSTAGATLSGRVYPWKSTFTKPVLQRRLGTTGNFVGLATLTPNSTTGNFTRSLTGLADGQTTQYRVLLAPSGGYSSATSRTLTLRAGNPVIAASFLADGIQNASYLSNLQTLDNRPGTWTLTSGVPPTGLILQSSGELSGIPTATGPSTFSVQFTDAANHTAAKTYTVIIDPANNPNTPSSTRVAAGNAHVCRVKADLALQCWGWNVNGQVGSNSFDQNIYAPQPVGSAWAQVSPGHFAHTCGVKDDYSLWCWGNGGGGELGNGQQAYYRTPQRVAAGTHWKQATAGLGHSCAIRTDGSLWCWGQQQASALVPGQINPGTTWSQVDAGNNYTCGIQTDQTLWCWGANNNRGWLGNGTQNADPAPTKVGTSSWIWLTTGQGHTCGIKTDTTLWCWGKNSFGSVGDGSTDDRLVPTQISGTNWTAVSANGSGNFDHTCATKSDNTLWCWGANVSGELGDGTTDERHLPTQVAGTDWASVAVGGSFTCATKTVSGNTFCWGANNNGQAGQNAPGVFQYLLPTQVPN